MDLPIVAPLDERAGYDKLVALPHPDGLACPRRGAADRLGAHRRRRDPVLDHRCGHRRRAFNAFTGTARQGVPRRPSQVVLALRGIAQGVPTARPARDLGGDRMHLLELQHRPQGNALARLDRNPLGDARSEADEMYQDAGEKGAPHPDPSDPPRRRADGRRGHGTSADDRPPMAVVVGRQLGAARLEVVARADGATPEGATVSTDEWKGDNGLTALRRAHVAVGRADPRREWARDDDGDGRLGQHGLFAGAGVDPGHGLLRRIAEHRVAGGAAQARRDGHPTGGLPGVGGGDLGVVLLWRGEAPCVPFYLSLLRFSRFAHRLATGRKLFGIMELVAELRQLASEYLSSSKPLRACRTTSRRRTSPGPCHGTWDIATSA